MQRITLIGVLLGLLAVTASAATAPVPQVKDYLGKWEFVIVNSNSTFRSCSLLLDEKAGGLLGEMVWRWGSVWKITDPKIVSVNARGELQVTSNRWAEPLTFRRFGNAIEGTAKQKNGQTFYLFGTQGSEVANVAGTWEMTMTSPDGGNRQVGMMKLEDAGYGRISAHVCDEYGQKLENMTLKDIKLAGTALSLSAEEQTPAGQTVTVKFTGQVQGDRIVGSVVPPQQASVKLPVIGKRLREWGKPVTLLAQNGLEGWHPRNSRKSFDWTCENGVLTNRAGTVDIVSDLKFKDFKLHLEYKVAKGSNSGVYLRGRYEAQILDDFGREPESHGNGAIYSRIPQKINASKAPDTWQTYDITIVGRYVTIVLNGTTIVDNAHLDGITGGALDPFEDLPGPLMLQGDHGKVWYRNILVYPAQ